MLEGLPGRLEGDGFREANGDHIMKILDILLEIYLEIKKYIYNFHILYTHFLSGRKSSGLIN